MHCPAIDCRLSKIVMLIDFVFKFFQLVIEYRNAFYARGWANSKCGGIAIRER